MGLTDALQSFNQSLLVGKYLILLRSVFLFGKELVEVSGHEPIKLCLGCPDLFLDCLCRFSHVRDVGLTIRLKLSEHPVNPIIRDACRRQDIRNLHVNRFLPHVRLRAVLLHSLGASQVVVTLLRFSGDEAAAFAAAEESSIQVRLEAIDDFRLALAGHDFLTFVEQLLTDDRLMLPLVVLPSIADRPVVDGVLQKPVILGA